jgi:hypothetical protein
MTIDHVFDAAEEVGTWAGKEGEGALYYKVPTNDFWKEEDHMYLTKIPEMYQAALRKLYRDPHILFSKRLVKCFDDPELCLKFKAQGNYGNDICKGCEK